MINLPYGVVCDAQCELATEESLLSSKFALESDMTTLKADLRADMAEMKAELKSDMKNLEVSVEKQFAQLYRHLLVGGGACVTVIVALLGVTIVLTRGGGF